MNKADSPVQPSPQSLLYIGALDYLETVNPSMNSFCWLRQFNNYYFVCVRWSVSFIAQQAAVPLSNTFLCYTD